MTDRSTDHCARLDALETQVAHQDRTMSDLNDVIATQWRKIDALERRLAQLREEFLNLAAAPREAPEPPPPHY